MANDFGGMWRSALDANSRYYAAWGRLATDYLRDLGAAITANSSTIRLPTVPSATSTVVEAPSAARNANVPTVPSVALEGPTGARVTGAVLVQNYLTQPVSALVVARVDDDLAIEVSPARVDLAPGESAVVKVSVVIPPEGAAERWGELSVPDLVGTSVPLVVIRRPSTDRVAADVGA